MTSLDKWLEGRFLHWIKDIHFPDSNNRCGQILATSNTHWLIEEYIYYSGEEWSKEWPQLFRVDDILECHYTFADSIEELSKEYFSQSLHANELMQLKPTIVRSVGDSSDVGCEPNP